MNDQKKPHGNFIQAPRTCSFAGCTKETKMKRLVLCSTHYAYQRRRGTQCSVVECTKEVAGLGMCPTHYARKQKGLPLDAPVKPQRARRKDGRCVVDRCLRRSQPTASVCSYHHWQMTTYRIPFEDLSKWDSMACLACGSTKRLSTDHDHVTGRLRGRLCHGCNVALGFLEEDTDRMRGLIAYVDAYCRGNQNPIIACDAS